MTPEQLWQEYKTINPAIGDTFDAWSFGAEADQLAELVLQGQKRATASAYDLYHIGGEELPQVGTFDVILDSQGQAVCIIEITNVEVVPFKQVSEEHAFKEGEGGRSLAYWRQVHEDSSPNGWLKQAFLFQKRQKWSWRNSAKFIPYNQKTAFDPKQSDAVFSMPTKLFSSHLFKSSKSGII